MAGYGPRGHKELDTTKQLIHTYFCLPESLLLAVSNSHREGKREKAVRISLKILKLTVRCVLHMVYM